jgi:hypothetical protein
MIKTITKLFAIFIAIALCACLFVGCSSSGNLATEKEVSKNSSFVIVEDGAGYCIVYHKDTKVMYTISTGGSNLGTFCLLVNPDGTPMIWEGS